MKALQKTVHFCLIAAILLASFGFKLTVPQCAADKGSSVGFFSASSCCCIKVTKEPANSCESMDCVLQRGLATPTVFTGTSEQQVVQLKKENIQYPDFSAGLWTVVPENFPSFTFPPPVSGRFLGILHQTYLI